MDQATQETNAPARFQIEPHLADDDLLVWRHRGTSGRLVLCFTGIGPSDGAIPTYEFAKIATGNGQNNVLFIVDPNRTWLNGDGLIEKTVNVVEDFAEQVGVEDYLTLGHSMGGFAAIVISDYLPVRNSVALSPQFSVHPDIVGDDQRWMYFRRHIRKHRLRSVEDHMVSDTNYHVFHGGAKVERPQRNRFPVMKNMMHMILPGMAHAVPQKLKAAGLLDPVVRACFSNRTRHVRRLLDPIGGHPRKLRRYPALAPSSELIT